MGYDVGKKLKGRRLRAPVDTEGLPLRVVVHSADIQDHDGAAREPSLRIEIIKRSDDMKGFVVLPRRWVVERTLSWLGRNRRLGNDYENLAATLTTFVTLAAIQLGIRRLARA